MSAPTYEEPAALVVASQARIAGQDAAIAELERQLAASLRNSSQPPSTHWLDKPAPKSLHGRSGRTPGGQPGRQGRTLQQVQRPDDVVGDELSVCTGCGGTLAAEGRPAGVIRQQAFDIPRITLRMVEHQLISRRCGECGAVTQAAGAAELATPLRYDPHAAVIAVYFCVGQHLPVARTGGLLTDLFGTPMSTGAVVAWTAQATAEAVPSTAAARAALTVVEPVHLDETGLRAAGQLAPAGRSLHRRIHRLFCPRKRDEAIDAAGVLPHFIGIAVHDAFASYGRYPVATHALCNVPLLRALIAAVDHRITHGATAVAMPTGWCWAARVIGALVALKAIPDIGAPPDSNVLAASRRPIVSSALIGASAEVGLAGAVGRRHRAPARRIRSRLDDYLRLAPDLRGRCDSNPVHRDIRMAKIEPPGASAPSPARRTSPRCGPTSRPRPSTAADPSTSPPNSPAGTSGSPAMS